MPATGLNLLVAAGLACAQLLAMVGVPLLTDRWAVQAVALGLGLVLPSLTLWALLHECMHGHFAGGALNQTAGRLLAVLHGGPYSVLRTGHLLHHRHNREPCDASEVYDHAGPRLGIVRLAYYLRLFGVLYGVQMACSLIFLLPRRCLVELGRRASQPTNVIGTMLKSVLLPATLRRVRQDGVGVLLLWTFSAACLGSHAWLLLAATLGRACVISMHDNVYHYGTSPNERRAARTLRLPGCASRLILNFNYHHTHHRHPEMPWRALPDCFERERRQGVPGEVSGWGRAWARQLAGPLPRSRLDASPLRSDSAR